MPVSLVFYVNFGILLSGLMILKYVFNINNIILLIISIIFTLLLIMIYLKNKKINTIAVLIGAFGYLSIYISLIVLSINNYVILPIIMCSIAILLFIMLCCIGINANLGNPKVHWLIEISNVLCLLLVALGTLLLFDLIDIY